MGKIGISPNQLLSKNGTKMTEDQNVKITSNTKSADEMYEYDVFQHVVALSFLSNNHRVKNTKLST